MNRKQAVMCAAAAAALLIIGIVSGMLIKRDIGLQRTECELYFLNDTGTSIEAETREIKYSDAAVLPQNVVVQLLKGPEDSRHSRLIDRKTRLLHLINEGEGRITADFSSEFLSGDNMKNTQAAYSVVKSLCSIEGVKSVKVLVQGEGVPVDGGGTIGYLTSDDINLSADTSMNEKHEVALYFSKKDSDKLFKTTRVINVADQKPLAQYIISELIKGPNEGYTSVIDKKTELISVDTEDGICFVNFGTGFAERNSGDDEKKTIYAIVNSLTELDNISSVQFLIEGKKVSKFGGIDISEPFSRNGDIIGTE